MCQQKNDTLNTNYHHQWIYVRLYFVIAEIYTKKYLSVNVDDDDD